MATLFTNKAKDLTVQALIAWAQCPKFIGWGTGTGGTVTATALVAEAPETATTKATGVASQVQTTVVGDTLRIIGTITAAAARLITEAATFTAAAAGNIFVYGDFGVMTLAQNDSIEFTIDLKYS
jgi:hypothetical protein